MEQLDHDLEADTHGMMEDSRSQSDDTPDLESGGPAEKPESSETWDWNKDPSNPYNWPTIQKVLQVVMIAWAGLTTLVIPSAQCEGDFKSDILFRSLGVSIISPAHSQFMEEFGVSSTVAILPMSLYVLALGLGPVVGGPLSETVGRFPIYIGATALGSLFTLGVGFCPTFSGLCVLRFLAGFCYAPILAIASGTINETFRPVHRGLPSAFFILTPFLGPGLGSISSESYCQVHRFADSFLGRLLEVLLSIGKAGVGHSGQ